MKNRKTLADAGATAACGPYADRAAFLDVLRQGFEALSRQLKAIGRHVEMQGDRLAFDGIQATAEQCGVQPSAVVRFAKHFGFSGYSELQALFRADAARQLSAQHDYQDRIRGLIASGNEPRSSARLAHEVIEGSIESLQALQRGLPPEQFEAAVDLMLDAPRCGWPPRAAPSPWAPTWPMRCSTPKSPCTGCTAWAPCKGRAARAVARRRDAGRLLRALCARNAGGGGRGPGTRRAPAGADRQPAQPLASRATVTLLAQDAATFGFRS